LLIGAYASTLISPEIFWPIAFLGLAFPFIALINIFFVFLWAIQINYRCLYSFIALAIGWQFIIQTFKIKSTESTEKGIKIENFNAGLFGYFQNQWQSQQLINHLENNKPDILCVQEFLNLGSATNGTLDSIQKAGNFKYYHFEKLKDGRKKGQYGLAIFSNYEIKETGLVHFDQITGNMCIYADIEIDSIISRIYNVHLQSFRFNKKDFAFIKDIPEDNKIRLEQSKSMIERMKNTYLKRAEQVNFIKKNIRSVKTPYFVIGDFNDPSVSYAYATLSKNLKDAFTENGKGFGKTYIGLMPNFRIDYILYPKQYVGLNYSTYNLASDHKLIQTIIKLKP